VLGSGSGPGQTPAKRNEVCGTDAGQTSGRTARGSGSVIRNQAGRIRALGIKDKRVIQLLSRRNNSLNDKFPFITDALKNVEDGLNFDGEIVALDAEGRPSFNLLQHRKANAQAVVFYLF